ncbi:hypothetical protein HG531_012853 [Fusarium graminearum]|nr:hypothetical protein HG531_012853 [Fusarium graminearum]
MLPSNTAAGNIFAHVFLKNGVKVGFRHHGPCARALGLLGKLGAKTVQIELASLCLGTSLEFLPNVKLIAVHVLFLGGLVVTRLLLSINLINQIGSLLVLVVRLSIGAVGCHVVRSKEITVKSIVEEVVKRWVGQNIGLRLAVIAKELWVELSTVLLRKPVKVGAVEIDIAELASIVLAGLFLTDGSHRINRLETHRRLVEGFRRGTTRRAGTSV